MEPAQSRVPTPSPTRGWHARAAMPIIPPCQQLFPGHRRLHPPGRPPATRAELQGRERGGSGGSPGTNKTRPRQIHERFYSDFFPFSLPPMAAVATARAPSLTPAPPSRRAGRCRDSIATVSRPSVLCRPVPTALPSAGRAHLAPPPRGRAPTAAQQPRPAVRTAMAAAAAGEEEPPGRGRRGPGRGDPRPAHAPRSGSGTGGGAHARCCCCRLRPDDGKGGREAAAEGGRKRWRAG